MHNNQVLIIILLLSSVSGCATLDKSECESANWEVIGFEDGAAGRSNSRISLHRKACAEYAVKPDLNRYLSGHDKGLVKYCTYKNGVMLGERGRPLSNICDTHNSNEFTSGYHKGKSKYDLKKKIVDLKLRIKDRKAEIEQIQISIKIKEDLVLSNAIGLSKKRLLLEEIKGLQSEVYSIESSISVLQSKLSINQNRLSRF